MIPYFLNLGQRIERAWLARGYDEEVFPELALGLLAEEPPSEHVGAADIVDWIFGASHPFLQPSGRELFGEPPVLVYQGPRFYIEALFWMAGTTSIHEHGFSGAFAVLAGSSVHSHWRFVLERAVNSRLQCGRLERVSTEILRPGAMRKIDAGSRLIHQLFHLELPSVTIVVRTYADRNHQPQYQYLPPGLAIDPEDHDPLRARRLLFLDNMARGRLPGLPDYAGRLIAVADPETLFYMFSTLTLRKVDRGLVDELFRLARERHGAIVDLFRQVCEEQRRTRVVTALREKVVDPQARFLMALLMLMPDRDAILETVQQQFPDLQPVPAIETWVEAMAGKETIGFNLTDLNRTIFRGLVEGADTKDLLQRLRTDLQAGSATDCDHLLDHAMRMARLDLFYPLFSRSPLREAARTA
jgi:hypothetical protein